MNYKLRNSIIIYGNSIQLSGLIHLESAPLYVTSTFQISCEQFDKNFTELKKIIEIKSNYFVNLNHLLHTSNSVVTRNGIDVRGKIVIMFDNNLIRKICFDEFGTFSEGTKYFKNKRLWEFIQRNKLVANDVHVFKF